MLDFHINADRCILCGECAADCPLSLIDMKGDLPVIAEHRQSHCIGCLHCLAVCPTAALSILGHDPDACAGIQPVSADAVENLLKSRRSIRRFKPEGVKPGIITRLMDVTAHAPTGKNQRQVRLTLIDDPVVMERIRQETVAGIRKAMLEDGLPDGLEFFAKLVEPFDRGKDIIFRWAPHMLIASSPHDAPSPEADPFIALNTFEIMAQTLGVGTLWCGFARWALQSVVPEVSRKLGIPWEHRSMYVLLFGYPAVRYARVVPRAQHDVHRIALAQLEGTK